MKLPRQKSATSEWANLEDRLDSLVSKAYLIDHLEKLQSNSFMYRETANEEKIFRAGARGFELVKTVVKEHDRQGSVTKVDPLKYLNETILELSAVEDAEALLTGSPKAVKKEDGTVPLLESIEPSP
jgi:hypothetical protein